MPLPAAAGPAAVAPSAPDQTTDCTNCAAIRAQVADLTLELNQAKNDVGVYQERILQMEEHKQALVDARDQYRAEL